MKNLESMLHFWNMAGMNGAYFIKPLKRKAILNFFIGISLVGFYLIEFTILGLSFPASGTFLSGIELPKFLGLLL